MWNNVAHTRSDAMASHGGANRKELDMELGLKAESSAQKMVLDYLEANASEVLAEKIKTGNKTLGQCWTYIVKQAQKQKEGNCACIPDMEVFGWAIHFFEEDSITEKETAKPVARVEVKEVKKAEPKKEKSPREKSPREEMLPGQMTIFDLMGGGSSES